MRVKVSAAVNGSTVRHLAIVDVSAERILEELAVIAFSNIRDFITIDNDGVAIVDWDNMPDGASRAIANFSKNSITIHSKLDALKTLIAYMETLNRRRVAEESIDVTPVSEMDIIEKARIIGLMMTEGYELLKLQKAKETKH